ncbi:hypothetical protein, partial [Enterobacter hormaechei]
FFNNRQKNISQKNFLENIKQIKYNMRFQKADDGPASFPSLFPPPKLVRGHWVFIRPPDPGC